MSRFFNQPPQTRLSFKVPDTCLNCGKPIQKKNVSNSVWQFQKHIGYVCNDPKCLAVIAQK